MVKAFLDRSGIWLAWAVLLGGLAGLVLAQLGGLSPWLDLFSHASGHLIGAVLFAVLALAIGYRPVVVLTLGLFLTLTVHALLAQLAEVRAVVPAAAASPGGGAVWKVVSLNTWHRHAEPGQVAAYLEDERADLALLYDFGPDKIAYLHGLAAVYPFRAGCAESWRCAVVVLSRRPFSASGVEPSLGAGQPPRVWVRFGEGARSLTVIATHLMRPTQDPVAHAAEMAAIAAEARLAPGAVLLAGDLNDTPWSAAFRRLVAGSGLRHMGRFLPSYPSGPKGLPQLAIDHLLASSEVIFERVALGPDVGSSHRPLVAEVRLPAAIGSAGP